VRLVVVVGVSITKSKSKSKILQEGEKLVINNSALGARVERHSTTMEFNVSDSKSTPWPFVQHFCYDISSDESEEEISGRCCSTVSGYFVNTITDDLYLFTTGHGIYSSDIAKANRVTCKNNKYTFINSVHPDFLQGSAAFDTYYSDNVASRNMRSDSHLKIVEAGCDVAVFKVSNKNADSNNKIDNITNNIEYSINKDYAINYGERENCVKAIICNEDNFKGEEIFTYNGSITQGTLKIIGFGHRVFYFDGDKYLEILYFALPAIDGADDPDFGDSGSAVYNSKHQLNSFLKGSLFITDTEDEEFMKKNGGEKNNQNVHVIKQRSQIDSNLNIDGDKIKEYTLLTPCHLALKQCEKLIYGSQLEFCNVNIINKIDEQNNLKKNTVGKEYKIDNDFIGKIKNSNSINVCINNNNNNNNAFNEVDITKNFKISNDNSSSSNYNTIKNSNNSSSNEQILNIDTKNALASSYDTNDKISTEKFESNDVNIGNKNKFNFEKNSVDMVVLKKKKK
jgi:hypothetical protein